MYFHQGRSESDVSNSLPPMNTPEEIDRAIHTERLLRERAWRDRYEGETRRADERGRFALLEEKIILACALSFLAAILVCLIAYPHLIPGTLFGSVTIALLRAFARRGRPAGYEKETT